MDPLQPATVNLRPFKEHLAFCKQSGLTKEQANDSYHYMKRLEHWMNDTYHVSIDKQTDMHGLSFPVWHLAIKRNDRAPCTDWRDFQAIKNQLVGEECEAVEMYPAESRLMDTANSYHLWAFPDGHKLAIGWTERAVTSDPMMPGAKQRPLE